MTNENGQVESGRRPILAIFLVAAHLVLYGLAFLLTQIEAVATKSLGVAIPTAAIITLTVFWTDSRDLRTAIAATFLSLYVGFFSATFDPGFRSAVQEPGGILGQFYISLSAVMVTIVAFYFGGKAYESSRQATTHSS